jgi:hypothetical protein
MFKRPLQIPISHLALSRGKGSGRSFPPGGRLGRGLRVKGKVGKGVINITETIYQYNS